MGKYQDFCCISLEWIIFDGYCRWKLSSGDTIHGSTLLNIHELVVRARQLASVAQLVRARQLASVAQLVRARQLASVAQLVRARQLASVAQLVRARQLASVAQLVRALHRNRRAAGSIPARDLKLYFSLLFLVRSNKCIYYTLTRT